jgi:hypothetical protein
MRATNLRAFGGPLCMVGCLSALKSSAASPFDLGNHCCFALSAVAVIVTVVPLGSLFFWTVAPS